MKPRDPIFLVGHVTDQIVGAKQPSKKQVLSVLFYKIRKEKAVLKRACSEIDQVNRFWEKATIEVKRKDNWAKRLELLHKEWKVIIKDKNRKGDRYRKNEQDFTNSLDDLFDVAHEDALKTSSKDAKEFLIANWLFDGI